MINRILIIFFVSLTLLLIIFSVSFQKFSKHFFKIDNEMIARINYLSKLHKSFYDSSKDKSVVRFIYPMDFRNRQQSYFNNYTSHPSFYGNYYWIYEKGKELYGLDNPNIFHINDFSSIYLLNKKINLNDICKKVDNNFTGNLNFSQNILFFNEDSLKTTNQIIKLNYKIKTTNMFSSVKIYNSSGDVIARTEINLANSLNSELSLFSNKIINSDENIFLLNAISKSPSSQLLETSEIEIILFKKNNNKITISFDFYDNEDEFYKFMDVNFNNIELDLKSINKKYSILEKNKKLINCS
jgi:hypothetical protein